MVESQDGNVAVDANCPDCDVKNILFSIHIGQLTIDIKQAIVTWLFTVVGTYVLAHSDLDPTKFNTWLGFLTATVSGFFHLKKVHDTNATTKVYKALAERALKG